MAPGWRLLSSSLLINWRSSAIRLWNGPRSLSLYTPDSFMWFRICYRIHHRSQHRSRISGAHRMQEKKVGPVRLDQLTRIDAIWE